MCPEAFVISGDFNLHLGDFRDIDTKKFEDLLETFNLSQHVSGPTHLSGHTLDLIITRSSDDIVLASPKNSFSHVRSFYYSVSYWFLTISFVMQKTDFW